MAETFTLQTPQTTPPVVNSGYRIVFQLFDIVMSEVRLTLHGDNKEVVYTGYGGLGTSQAEKDKAIQVIKFLNTSNNSVKSMQKRILEQLAADGKLPPGQVTGTPD